MKMLNPKLVLDPAWICKAYTLDLEYYQYLLLGAQQVYLRNLELGKFDNFYEIAFHYFNLNSVISGGKLYGSGLKVISSEDNLSMISAQLADKADTPGKEIVKVASGILAKTMNLYLTRQISGLEKIHFYFNNNWIHEQPRVYFVFKTVEPDEYEVVKLNLRSTRGLGYSVSVMTRLTIPDLKESRFKEHLLAHKPLLKDFDPEKNVMVIGNGVNLDPVNRICLAKDTVLLNRIVNSRHGFDANVLLDFHRLLEKQKGLPFKIKA